MFKELIIEATTTEADLLHHLHPVSTDGFWYLLDVRKNGIGWTDIREGRPFELAFLREQVCARFPIYLSMDFNADEVETVIESLHPLGICVIGGDEEKTGYKSFDELDALFEQLEVVV